MNQQGWRLAAETHFPDALEVLCADCAVDLDSQPPIWWEQLYHFLTRVRSTLPGESSLNWHLFHETAALGTPLRSPAPVLYCQPARSSNLAGGPPPTPELYLRRPMLMAEADWHQGTDEMDVRRITVYVSWRAYCPSFARSQMCTRLFSALGAPQQLMGHTLADSVLLQQCPYCSARIVELAEPEPDDATRFSWFTPDFEKLLLTPVRDALPEEGLDEPPLYGSLADDEEWTRDTHALVVCANGHFLFAETWPMVDREACEDLASDDEDDEDEDEDEYYGGGHCAYGGGHYSGMGHFGY